MRSVRTWEHYGRRADDVGVDSAHVLLRQQGAALGVTEFFEERRHVQVGVDRARQDGGAIERAVVTMARAQQREPEASVRFLALPPRSSRSQERQQALAAAAILVLDLLVPQLPVR